MKTPTNPPILPTIEPPQDTFTPPPDSQNDVTTQIRLLSQQVLDLQSGKTMKTSSNLCPYLFDKSLAMKLFPKGFEIPKFDKYQGTGNPEDHIKEF